MSLPVQQYGSAASQYDWMMLLLAGAQVKPAGRAANFPSVSVNSIIDERGGNRGTYALCLACADVVWKTVAVVRVAHEDGCLHGCQSCTGKSSTCTSAERIVHDLTTLGSISHMVFFPSLRYIPGSSQ